MGEFDLIRRHFARAGGARRALLGIGDDCALLDAPASGADRFAVSTDLLVEGTHFFADVDPESLGHKALAVNLSDLAAMGARPAGYLLALALPVADEAWLAAFAAGMHALADRHGAELVGGDTTRGPLAIGVTVFGEVAPGRALRRDRARAGDDIWVSGTLGAAAFAVRERLAGRALPAGHPALERLERPQPRVALGVALAASGLAHAAIDLSDGLAGDLGHVLERSAAIVGAPLGATLDGDALPIHPALAALSGADRLALALHGGDDYELAFTAPPAARGAITAMAAAHGPLARVGTIEPLAGLRLRQGDDEPRALDPRGYDHFQAQA